MDETEPQDETTPKVAEPPGGAPEEGSAPHEPLTLEEASPPPRRGLHNVTSERTDR